MSGGFLLGSQIAVTPVDPPQGRAAELAAKFPSGTALQVAKTNPLVAFAKDTRERTGGCLVKTGAVVSTAVGSLAIIGLTAAGVALAGAGSVVTEVVAGAVALNWLFGWASRPLIAAGAVILGEKPRETIRRVLS